MKKKVLVADETSSILKIMSLILSNEYDIVLKSNGIEAVTWLDGGNKPQLIIADIRFPGYLGEAFIHFVKGNIATSNVPVILTSIADDLEDKVSSLPFRIEGILKKPFNSADLKSTIHKVLNEVTFNPLDLAG